MMGSAVLCLHFRCQVNETNFRQKITYTIIFVVDGHGRASSISWQLFLKNIFWYPFLKLKSKGQDFFLTFNNNK